MIEAVQKKKRSLRSVNFTGRKKPEKITQLQTYVFIEKGRMIPKAEEPRTWCTGKLFLEHVI